MRPGVRVINVHCRACNTKLYKYRKEGLGHLLKCYVNGILKDHTKKDLKCHNCGQQFARPATIKGRSAHKIIQGKVYVK